MYNPHQARAAEQVSVLSAIAGGGALLTGLVLEKSAAPLSAESQARMFARLEEMPGWWIGRAQTRREMAAQFRAESNDRAADECDRVATEYEDAAKARISSLQ